MLKFFRCDRSCVIDVCFYNSFPSPLREENRSYLCYLMGFRSPKKENLVHKLCTTFSVGQTVLLLLVSSKRKKRKEKNNVIHITSITRGTQDVFKMVIWVWLLNWWLLLSWCLSYKLLDEQLCWSWSYWEMLVVNKTMFIISRLHPSICDCLF